MNATEQRAQAFKLIQMINDAIVESVAVAGQMGIGEGVIYAALTGKMDLDTFQAIIRGLVEAGKLERFGDHGLRVPAAKR